MESGTAMKEFQSDNEHGIDSAKEADERKKSPLLLLLIEIVLFVTAVVLVVAAFSTPAIFHFTDSTKPTNLTLLQEKLFALQSNTSFNHTSFVIDNSTKSCESEGLTTSWAYVPTNALCAIEPYNGTYCKSYLQVWQSCVLEENRENIQLTTLSTSQESGEALLVTLDSFLNLYPECKSAAVPFLCQYSFPLADCVLKKAFYPSYEECTRISKTVCATLWNFAASSPQFRDKLPVCQNLPRANSYPSVTQNETRNTTTIFNVTELECREDFIVINATCHPRCDKFIQSPYTATIFLMVAELLAAVVVIIASVLIGIFVISKLATLFSGPPVLMIFMACNMLLQAILVVISASDRNNFFCSSPSVIGSLDDPTLFTVISGILNHFLLINMVLWWFFHVAIHALKIMFPLKSSKFKEAKLQKYVLLFVIVLALLTPVAAVVVAMTSEKHGYRLHRLPAGLPTASNELWFYSVIFLYSIFLAGGIVMLAVVVWICLKQKIFKQTPGIKKSQSHWSLLVYFSVSACYFTLYTVYSSVWTVNYNKLTNSLTEYFLCEGLGHQPDKCSREEFESYSYPYFEGITAIFKILIPISIIIAIINIRNWSHGKSHVTNCCNSQNVEDKGSQLSVVNPSYI